ncbi:unnamed protein product [Litomosoides sigmodontis]|uniref:V-type proton ATPase subunit C n=1 Tax=Litomosoides sigmodontis TaxID=42156 RepID=A0A3P6T1E8_LITSI|nr:unnamed protein product [Litomosoides sigmodontis]VDK81762.1 unnamed protein product [Litomosoides sigmodontis]VDK82530.1 unnamed protein product [Litomosoides sigmodontis]
MFLISTPVEGSPEANWLKLQKVAENFATFSNIPIPNFRTAPEAQLYELLKDMQLLDHSMENLFRSFLATFEKVLLFEDVDLLESLVIRKQRYGEKITDFAWNMAIYSPYLLLSDLCELFYKHFQNLNQQIRRNVATYKENLKIAREYIRAEETLVTQNLACFVREESVIDTEYIQTVFIAVPQRSTNVWLEVYETLHDSAVACSSCFITEDDDYKLYSMVVVREDFVDFRDSCAKYGFIARGYQSDPGGFARKFHERQKVEEAARYQNIMLIQWLKLMADEIFEVLIHVKVFRAYISSSIIYSGRRFQIIMFYPRKNLSQRLQSELTKLYEEEESNITDETDSLDSSDLSIEDSDSDSERESAKLEDSCPPYLIYKVGLPLPAY